MMTLLATPTARRQPSSHAFSTPVVREIAPPKTSASADVW
jgi:hypothetical protein